MKTVSVSELKAKLSSYLRDVARGGEIQIVDRGVPVARLAPIPGSMGEPDEVRHRLARSGVLRLGSGDVSALLRKAPLKLDANISEALRDDREDRI